MGQLLQGLSSEVQVSVTDLPAEAAEVPPPDATVVSEPEAEAPAVVPESERLKRLFAANRRGHLTLRKLPEHTADALLLVLYGMWKLRGASAPLRLPLGEGAGG